MCAVHDRGRIGENRGGILFCSCSKSHRPSVEKGKQRNSRVTRTRTRAIVQNYYTVGTGKRRRTVMKLEPFELVMTRRSPKPERVVPLGAL